MLIKDLPDGKIVWYKDLIVGIKGWTLEEKYGDIFDSASCVQLGNPYDVEINPMSLSDTQEDILIKALMEEEND